jgi:hypothetical protein
MLATYSESIQQVSALTPGRKPASKVTARMRNKGLLKEDVCPTEGAIARYGEGGQTE